MAKSFFANVKLALSGDTVIVTDPNNPALEKTISLAYVSAPRLRKEGDESWAFQSREYLRSSILSKKVRVTISYTVPGSGRDYGTIETQEGLLLPRDAVKNGWVKVREEAGRKEQAEAAVEMIRELRELEAIAKDENKGLHKSGGVIQVLHDVNSAEKLLKTQTKTPAIIERVFSGDRLLARLLLTEDTHLQVVVLYSGIRAPSTERTNPSTGQVQPAEEYANDARAFVEARLLQRQIDIEINKLMPPGQIIGTIHHPKGNIAELLLQEGLARVNDDHSRFLPGNIMQSLRGAEKKGRAAQRRLFKNAKPDLAKRQYELVVYKVISGDIFNGKSKAEAGNLKRGEDLQIKLTSIRAPRSNDAQEAPFRDAAKEFLRKKIIGKTVQISVDGHKDATPEYQAHDQATVTVGGKNVGLMLVGQGYASVRRVYKDDTDAKAPNYDELVAAQEEAKAEKKGMWSGKAASPTRWIDLTHRGDKGQLKLHLSTLQRAGTVKGIVDHCVSGSRFNILVPTSGIKIALVLAGIRAPRAAANSAKDDDDSFGHDAQQLAIRHCNQRDCEFQVHDIDKMGSFVGNLVINGKSFGKTIVEEGLANVVEFAAKKYASADELLAAQKKAKEAKKGMWANWDPSQDEEDGEEVDDAAAGVGAMTLEKRPEDYREIVITHIDTATGRLKIQEVGKGTAALETLMTEFRKFHADSQNNVKLAEDKIKAGDFVSAKFSEDGQWYRARIRSNDRGSKMAEVMFVDYGNSEKQKWEKLRPLDARFSTQKLKAQAVEAALSFVQMPTASEYLTDAIGFIYELTGEKQLVANFDFVDTKDNVNWITIFDPNSKGAAKVTESINREVILNGHGMVPRKLKPWERTKAFEPVLKNLLEAESLAKQDRLGMWEYGDITED